MNERFAALRDAYQRTTYFAGEPDCPRRFALRIGADHPDLDRWLAEHGPQRVSQRGAELSAQRGPERGAQRGVDLGAQRDADLGAQRGVERNAERNAEQNVDSWAFLTAFNPGSQQWSAADNARRQRLLEDRLRQLGIAFLPGEGVADDGRWPTEASVLAYGIREETARELGRLFEQVAIVVGRRGGPARLVPCDPSTTDA